MKFRVGIAGSGLIGRLLALACLRRGWEVSLFDQDAASGEQSCGWVAAGMIAPYAELIHAEPLLFQLGIQAIPLWQEILSQLTSPVTLNLSGTLLVAHFQDLPELARVQTLLRHKLKTTLDDKILPLSRERLLAHAPGLSPSIQQAYWLQAEACIDSREFFHASTQFFQKNNLPWFVHTPVLSLNSHEIVTADKKYTFDLVCDTRGLGAKSDCQGLRGVRGELVHLHAPTVAVSCSIRLLHPRYPIYISPRLDHHYVVGATTIESEDLSPISVESLLELLSAAYTVHPGFAEARVINTFTQARPSFWDHQPKISYIDGLLKINGLYRHGYLAGPAVVEEAMRLVQQGKNAVNFQELLSEEF